MERGYEGGSTGRERESGLGLEGGEGRGVKYKNNVSVSDAPPHHCGSADFSWCYGGLLLVVWGSSCRAGDSRLSQRTWGLACLD
jgi:hypothetical protein